MEATTAGRVAAAGETRGPRGRRRGGKLLDAGLNIYAGLALLYLLVPIAVILVFSFNKPQGRFNFIWQQFSFDAWKDPFGVPGIGDALRVSLEVAAVSTLIATALGTVTALALVRYEFRGRAPVNFFIFIPLATPEVVLGAALLSMFLNFQVATGFNTIVIAHIMFNLSFVIVTVRSRLIGFDRSLEEAAQDLGATPWQTFRLITLPLIMPGVVSAALLAFALSIDDYVITSFNNGSTITFPVFIWGAARVAIPPQIYVIASMIFLFTLAMMLLTVWQQRRAERMAAVRPDEPEPCSGVITAVGSLLDRERARFADSHPRSRELHERARGSLLAGVPMSWMTMWAGAHPVYLAEAHGASVVDVDGNEYADFCLGDTGAMAGHSPPVRAASRPGITTMLPTEDAAWVGEELARRFGLPLWQFSLTATDANRWMLRICRQVTGPPAGAGLQLVLPRLGRRGVRDARRRRRACARARATSAPRSTRPRPRAWPSSTTSSRSRRRSPTATWPAC